MSSPFGEKKDIDWKETGEDFEEGGEWAVEDVGKESPGVWDPDTLRNSTGDLDPWNNTSKPPDRIQDLPLPSLADPPPQSQNPNSEDGEQWPFKDACAFEESKKGKKAAAARQEELEEADDIDEDVGESFSKLKIQSEKKKDTGPSMPTRKVRSDSEDDALEVDDVRVDKPPTRKPRALSKSRRSKDKLASGGDNPAEDLFDRRSRSRSREGRRSKSKGSRSKTDGAEKPRRRAVKKDSVENQEPQYEEEMVETMEMKLKGGESDDENQMKVVTPTAGRPGHRRRKSGGDGDMKDPDAIQRRAQESIANANAEMSRSSHSGSSHSARRQHSGGVDSAGRPLSAGSRNTRSARRKKQDMLGTASYHETLDDRYQMNLSGRTDRSLDSIEDLEDFEHVDFQTPGIVMDYDEEIEELMHKNVPEHTAQLNRRVHRKRDQVAYDQNMPMMTRQALMTQRASAMAMRGRVDVSNDERRRMMLDDSSHGKDAMGRSGHGRRGAPSRTRSSTIGMQAMVRGGAAADANEDNKRSLFRTRSGAGTNSFMKYMNKPNKVAQASGPGARRPPPRTTSGSGDALGRHSQRGPPSASAAVERRGALQRAKSTTALTRPQPTRRDPRALDKEAANDAPKPLRKGQVETDSDSDAESTSSSGDSSVDSMAEDVESPVKKPARSAKGPPVPPPRSPPVKKIKSPKAARKKFDKRDFKVEKSRRKLHAVMFEAKMGVNMKDLIKKVKKDGKTGVQPKPLYVEA